VAHKQGANWLAQDGREQQQASSVPAMIEESGKLLVSHAATLW